ncbi:MAG: helix-turn-helix domain-containing protein [Clostridia bacterium]|nr:helix-turn-helix domain-containing protein [Clostridia bacterium]
MDIHTLNPYIRVAMRSVLPAGHTIRRIIYDYELIFLESGNLRFCYADREYCCHPGQWIFIRPGIPHSFHCEKGEVSQPHIHFDLIYTPESEQIPVCFQDLPEADAGRIRPDIFRKYPLSPLVKLSSPELFFSVLSAEPLLQKGLFLQLFHALITENFPGLFPPAAKQSVARQIKDYIDSGQGLPAGLEELEKQFNYSRFYLEKAFRREFGTSLIAYRNEKRMEFAQKLLETHSVTTAAERVGYRSIYAFSRAYKNHFGVPPSKKLYLPFSKRS